MVNHAFFFLTLLLAASATRADDMDVPATRTVPAGQVILGADNDDSAAGADEFPKRRVAIASAFGMGATHVTRGQFRQFVQATGFSPDSGCWTLTGNGWAVDPAGSWLSPGFEQADSHPVVCVSRDDALAYAAWLTEETGIPFRLPSESEWTLAAGPSALSRASEELCTFGNINDLTAKNKVAKVAEHCDDGFLHTAPVKSFSANEFGLFDMIGNVWEWTADCHGNGYDDLPDDGSPRIASDCAAFALRGHSWTDPPGPVRLGTRYALPDDTRQSIVGFRIARDIGDG